MQLGAFSVSLAVEDIAASRASYEKLGFEVIGGELRAELERRGIAARGNAGDCDSGAPHFTLTDPDGNPPLVDQHV